MSRWVEAARAEQQRGGRRRTETEVYGGESTTAVLETESRGIGLAAWPGAMREPFFQKRPALEPEWRGGKTKAFTNPVVVTRVLQ